MSPSEYSISEMNRTGADIFLLTKPPHSDRARVCMQLISKSKNVILYLAGDGVYALLENDFLDLPAIRVFACKEDTAARGILAGDRAEEPENFYEKLINDVMDECNKVYTF